MNTGYDIGNEFLEVMIVKKILTVTIMLSLSGCALKASKAIPAPIEAEIVTLESDAVKKPQVIAEQPIIKKDIIKPVIARQPIVKQAFSAQPAPIIKEAPIHKAINKSQIPPDPQVIQAVKRQESEDDSSIFSFFSSKPAPVKVDLKQECIGELNLPISLQRKFEEVQDNNLLTKAIGGPDQGKLCQGKVYQVKKNAQVNLFRTWNGNNFASQYGNWWTFSAPRGSVANYRQQNAICYQWTPLDKLSHCRLKAGSKIVVGTGQSVRCSENLTYSASQTQQVFIIDAQNAVADCRDYDAGFSWKGQVNKR